MGVVKLNKDRDNRATFFGLYVGCPDTVRDINGFLRLKDVSLLTDDELLDIAQIIFEYSDEVMEVSEESYDYYVTMIKDKFRKQTINATIKVVDYLRYKGYAWEWMGLSVVDQINRGWVMLRLRVGQ